MTESQKVRQNLLLEAAKDGNLKEVQSLIMRRTYINARDKNGYTPLMLASRYGHLSVVRFLISSGAKINGSSSKTKYGENPLILASRHDKLEVVRALIANKANINAKSSYGETPLILASRYGNLEVARELIANKADVSVKNMIGMTAYDYAKTDAMKELFRPIAKSPGINVFIPTGFEIRLRPITSPLTVMSESEDIKSEDLPSDDIKSEDIPETSSKGILGYISSLFWELYK